MLSFAVPKCKNSHGIILRRGGRLSFVDLSSLHHCRRKVENRSIGELVILNRVFVLLCVSARGASGFWECLIFIASLIQILNLKKL